MWLLEVQNQYLWDSLTQPDKNYFNNFFLQLNSRRDDIMTFTWDHRLKYFIYELTLAYVFQNMKWLSFDQIHHLHLDESNVCVLWLLTHNNDRSHCLTGCHFLTWFTVHSRDHKERWTATWGLPVIGEECSIIFSCYEITSSRGFGS